jgi:hypothetical protein
LEAHSPLLRRFVLQLLEILVALSLFLRGRKLAVVFHELLKANAVDERHSGDVDIFRLHLSRRVQTAILIPFDIDVILTRPPTVLGRH